MADFEKMTDENMQEYAKVSGAIRNYITYLHDVRKCEPQQIREIVVEIAVQTYFQERLLW